MGKKRSGNSAQLKQLVLRDKNICHYCKNICSLAKNLPNSSTRDHVIPFSLGGACELYNMVLACSACNRERGSILNYCGCSFCQNLITHYCNRTFFQMMGRLNIKRARVITRHGYFYTKIVGQSDRTFRTLADAINYIHQEVLV